MITFNNYGLGMGNKAFISYRSINPPNTAQLNSKNVPLIKPYITLGPASGDGTNGVAYYVDTLQLPDSQASFGSSIRAMFSMRNQYGAADFIPQAGVQPNVIEDSVMGILANLSSGQFVYFGPRTKDMIGPAIYDNKDSEWVSIASLQSVSQGCFPFYCKFGDNVEICLISNGVIESILDLRLANFESPVWNGDIGGGGYKAIVYA